MYIGFEPFVLPDSKILILGSFPSVKSREEGFYYGNRQNKFWKLLAEAFGNSAPNTVEEKKDLLRLSRVALWDVVISCDISGSMDKDIRSPVIADIPSLLENYPIESIITNGATAYKLLERNFPSLLPLVHPLPSTSPANARLDGSLWINALRELTGRQPQ